MFKGGNTKKGLAHWQLVREWANALFLIVYNGVQALHPLM